MNHISNNILGILKTSTEKKLKDTFQIENLSIPEQWEVELMRAPQIQVAELLLEKTKQEKNVSRAEYLPKVDLDSNYYLDRSGILEDSDWDVTVQATCW